MLLNGCLLNSSCFSNFLEFMDLHLLLLLQWVSLLYTLCILGLRPFAFSNKIELLVKKKTFLVLQTSSHICQRFH